MEKIFNNINAETINEPLNLILPLIQRGCTLGLIGELGTGKTFLTSKIAAALGFSNIICSPTFTILNQYRHPSDDYYLNHFDMYRISEPDELEYIGYYDYIDNSNYINIIEWADKIEKQLPVNKIIKINIEYSKNNVEARDYYVCFKK